MSDDLIERAWAIIANAGGGDWAKESADWQQAAAAWREEYHQWIDRRQSITALFRTPTAEEVVTLTAAIENSPPGPVVVLCSECGLEPPRHRMHCRTGLENAGFTFADAPYVVAGGT